MAAIAGQRPDEAAAGAAAVPDMVPAASAAGGDAEKAALDVNEVGLGAQIEALRKQQQAMQDQKKRLAKDLRNAVRKRKRLSERARKLSDKDLVAVLMMRKDQRDNARGHVLASDTNVGASRPMVEEVAARSSSDE